MVYSLVKDLPDILQSKLKSIGYHRQDIELEACETVSEYVPSGTGLRGFCIIVDLSTGKSTERIGSWGGSNMFSPQNSVDNNTNEYPIPMNVAVIKGTKGNNIFATIYLHKDNVVKFLPATKNELDDRDRWILFTYSGLTSAGRKNEYEREGDKPSEDDLNRLAGKGYLKRSKNGATQITVDGRNALNLEFGYQTIYHPNNSYHPKNRKP